MENVNCYSCNKVMYQTETTDTGVVCVASKEQPIIINQDETEYLQCPHCKALHKLFIEDTEKHGTRYSIIDLK